MQILLYTTRASKGWAAEKERKVRWRADTEPPSAVHYGMLEAGLRACELYCGLTPSHVLTQWLNVNLYSLTVAGAAQDLC